MNNKIITQKVTIIGVNAYDFKTKEGDKICGYRIHFYRDYSENESGIGKKYEYVFISKNSLDDLDFYKKKSYPTPATIEFEFVSLDRKPKALKVVF